jgi:2-oxoglutarate dehydrogenase E2 component (dihydrolipoamide succinyltransferase)
MSEVTLPALGESVTEGTVTRWLKNVGDTVAIDEPLVEVSTDKVDTEIPSPFAGTLTQIMVQEDETVAVGAVLAIVGEAASAAPAEDAPATPGAAPAEDAPATPGAAAPEAAVSPTESSPSAPVATPPVAAAPVSAVTPEATPPVAAPPVATPPVAAPPVATTPVAAAPVAPVVAAPAAPGTGTEETSSDPNYVTPIVRKLASELGIDLASIRGSGVGGRIRKEDLTAATSKAAPAAGHALAEASPLRGTTVPMSRLRKVLSERAVASMQQSAQLTSVVEVDVTKIAEMRQRVQAEFTQKAGTKLSFMPFFTLAAAEALAANPIINATVEDTNIVYHGSDNIAFAVDTERGLLTPVIKDAANMSIATMAKVIADMAERTRSNKLTPDELSGGTFTVTNTGSRGALFDTPVVFLPQSAILGTGVVTKRAAVVKDAEGNDAIGIRSMVYLALSYDHRIIDGADASRYLMQVKARLEVGNFEANLGI